MIDRRDMLKMGAAAPLLMSFPARAMIAPAQPQALVVDRRFDVSLAGLLRDLPRLVTDGDVTRLWVETLDPAWRKPGFALEGVTGEDVLFILEHFAWDRGRRVVHRQEVAPRSASRPALIHWAIAPVHPAMVS
ncbi:MAG TPA: hypothetical protein VNS79_02360 [Sphingobium sp.]|nr:hypothetical protein [Sphingobium sp.]